MGRLSKQEKEELLKLSKSPKMKEDLRKVNNYQKKFKKDLNVDEYIIFLNKTNSFINHRMKQFKKIQGDNFKL